MTGSLPNRQKKQRRQFRRCDAKRNTPMSRLSARVAILWARSRKYPSPPVCEAFAARAKAGSTHGKATVPRADTGSKIKQEKGTVPHVGPAPAHCVRQSRPLQGIPPLLKEMAFRCRIWSNRFLDRCFNSRKAQKFQRMMRCFGRFL